MKQAAELKEWSFRIAPLGVEKQVCLPHTWNVYPDRAIQLYRGRAEYQTTVTLGRLARKRVILYVGAAFHTARVYLNNQFAGLHDGSGYTPFELDLTAWAHEGQNILRITVDNQSREDMLPHALDYDWPDDGGLIRGVSLFVLDEGDIRGLVVQYSIQRQENGRCSGRMTVELLADEQPFSVCLIDCQTGKTVLHRTGCSGRRAGFEFEGLKLWEPGNPALYLVRAAGTADTAEQRIGLRTVCVSDGKVLLNGRPIRMKGCEWMPGSHPDHGMAEPLCHSIRRLEQLKNAGCTFTRFHWQQDSAVFDWCDENGLLVQEEIPYWGEPKKAAPLQLALAKKQAAEMLHYHGHHPSIICWGVGNELGGQLPETIEYVRQMVDFFRREDGTRLVNYVSNTVGLDENLAMDDATLHGDIAMWNEYLGLWQPCEHVEEVILRTYKKFGSMPCMITEFGLCEPAFEGGDERRTEILRQRVAIYNQLDRLAGYVWFSLNDYRTQYGEYGEGRLKQRIHGSTDLYGAEKPSYRVFAQLPPPPPLE